MRRGSEACRKSAAFTAPNADKTAPQWQDRVHNLSISVIIPHLNQPDALTHCLDALVNQDGEFTLDEIIVVDNGSQTPPSDICARFAKVVLLSEETPGPGPARNAGAAVAKGEILAFIDSDCAADPDWLAAITRQFRGHSDSEIIGGPVRIRVPPHRKLSALEAYEKIYAFRIEDYIARRCFAGTGNLAVRRAIFDVVGPFGGIWISEDMNWGQRAHKLGFRILFVSDMTVCHPPRSSFTALRQKWDRHIAHDQAELKNSCFPQLRTAVRAVALIFSPLAELPRIATTGRVKGARARWLALTCLTRIRLYRAWRMVQVLMNADAQGPLSRWNRP